MRHSDLKIVPKLPVAGSQLSAVFAADESRNRWAASYHEAGHAVFAYEVGWWVNHEGVDLAQQYTGLGCREIDYTPWRRAWVHLAGLMAEYRHLGAEPFPDDDDLAFVLKAVRDGRPGTGDEGEVFRALLDQFPGETDCGLLAKYRDYGAQVLHEMTANARLWRRIRLLAVTLFRKGRLTADEVEALIAR